MTTEGVARRWARGCLLALAALVAACATPETRAVLDQPGDLPRQVELADVPFHAQDVLMCGPASLAMALGWAGEAVTPQQVTPLVFTPGRDGTLQTEMVTAARRFGYLAYPVGDLRSLLAEVAAGHPVVTLQNLGLSWYPVWHYAVAIGYDLDAREMLLHSGDLEREAVSLKVFERTWARSGHWALVVLPPDVLPASAKELDHLDAALGLERAGRHDAAAAAFAAAVAAWPDSLPALLGLGNNRYAAGDLPGAARAFALAVQQHPGSGSAFNNLAHVLSELGRHDEALVAARRAVEIGGPAKDLFEQTLHEIETKTTERL